MSSGIKVVTAPFVNVTVTSTVGSLTSCRRFQKDLTVGDLKGKLELLTGCMSQNMVLEVYDKDQRLVTTLADNNALLGSYPVDDDMRIHVVDKSGSKGEFEDLSKVQKYEMSSDDYAKREDSVRAFKEKMKLGRFNEEEQKQKEEERKRKEQEETEKAATMKPGDRCEVHSVGQPTKRGTIMYVGEPDFKPGHWVGVQCDEPVGKNDGSVKGRSYFKCPPNYGLFTRPSNVTVGDFPELGLDDEEDMDEM